MNHSDSPSSPHPQYPRGFRARRGLNWGFLGLLYTSFYMCRYNFSIANKAISEEYGFSRAQMGYIITTALFAYACGQIINGLLTDRIGGKRAMLIGAAGTIVMNILFGAASFAGMLGLFIAIRGVDGYVQAFGAPGMVKINTAWFRHRERGPVLRHLRLHDQPRPPGHLHARAGAVGRVHHPRLDSHSPAPLALVILDAFADLRRGGRRHGVDGEGDTRASRLPWSHWR